MLRVAFWAAAGFAFVMAVLPHPPPIPGQASDKLLHILAFAALAMLVSLAFPAVRLRTLIAALAVFGGLIELIQAIPALNRDSEWLDLAADIAAVLVVAPLSRWIANRTRAG